jgi:hypothetical protein
MARAQVVALFPWLVAAACAQDNASEFFEKRVRPILGACDTEVAERWISFVAPPNLSVVKHSV